MLVLLVEAWTLAMLVLGGLLGTVMLVQWVGSVLAATAAVHWLVTTTARSASASADTVDHGARSMA